MGVFKKDEGVKPGGQISAFDSVDPGAAASVIGRTLFIKGQFSSDEEVLIEGRLEGKIKVKNRVVVGKNGTVNADIEANEVVVQGTVNGNVTCNHKVEVVPEGILNGNIVSGKVVLAEGAIFKGSIDMTSKSAGTKAAQKESRKMADSEEVVEAEVLEEPEEEQSAAGEEFKDKQTGDKK